jgi:hypothetical protein
VGHAGCVHGIVMVSCMVWGMHPGLGISAVQLQSWCSACVFQGNAAILRYMLCSAARKDAAAGRGIEDLLPACGIAVVSAGCGC